MFFFSSKNICVILEEKGARLTFKSLLDFGKQFWVQTNRKCNRFGCKNVFPHNNIKRLLNKYI